MNGNTVYLPNRDEYAAGSGCPDHAQSASELLLRDGRCLPGGSITSGPDEARPNLSQRFGRCVGFLAIRQFGSTQTLGRPRRAHLPSHGLR